MRRKHFQTHPTKPTLWYQNRIRIPQEEKTIDEYPWCILMHKFSKKKLANQIQEHFKRIMHHDQVVFIPGMQGWFNICKSISTSHQWNERWKSSNQLTRNRKGIWQNTMPFMIKTLNRLCTPRTNNILSFTQSKTFFNPRRNNET